VKFSSDLILLSAFKSLGVCSPSNKNEYQGMSMGVKFDCHIELTTAILIVPNVKVRMEAQYSIARLSLHDLLQESFTYMYILGTNSVI
jgi:hypothetical protein